MASPRRALVALVGLTMLAGCAPSAGTSGSPPPSGSATEPSAVASAPSTRTGSLVVVGRIVTMDEPPIAEALLIEEGAVTAVGQPALAAVVQRLGHGPHEGWLPPRIGEARSGLAFRQG